MSEWRELKTLQEVAAAQAAGEEIEVDSGNGWEGWGQAIWDEDFLYRSRPRKKVKQIVLREALLQSGSGYYYTQWYSDTRPETFCYFVRWLDTGERIVEIEE